METRLDRTETPRQRLIRETVAAFERKFSVELEAHKKDMKKLTGTRANVYAADKQGGDFVLALHLPLPLYKALVLVVGDHPPLFRERKESLWFMRTFPQYSVPEKV